MIQTIQEVKPTSWYSKKDAQRVLWVAYSTIKNRIGVGLLKTAFFWVKEKVTGESIIKLYEDRTGLSLQKDL